MAHTCEPIKLKWGPVICEICRSKIGNCHPTHEQPDYYEVEPEQKIESVYRGVYFDKTRGKWKSGVYFAGKSFPTGSFDSELDALHAYNKMALTIGAGHKIQEAKPMRMT